MKKNKFITSTIVLIIGGFITKLIGMVNRIVLSRSLGTEGLGLYMMIMPTFSMCIAISQFGLSIAISKLISENTKSSKKIISSSLLISVIINMIIMISLIFFGSFISNNLIHDSRTTLPINAISLTLPFISISSIARGYFFGKQKMIPHVISNITEDIVRLLILYFGIPIFLIKGIEIAITFVVLTNVVSELTSIIILFFFLPKNFSIKKSDLKVDHLITKDILSISVPTVISRFVGNIGYFFEPIIITSLMLEKNYSNNFIVSEYGIISGYVLPLLTLPSFFTGAISQALIPVISKNYVLGNIKETKRKLKQAIMLSFMVALPATIIFMTIPEIPLKFIYNTTEGINYIKFLAPICILLYFQSNLSATLQAMGKAKDSLLSTTIGMIIRISTLFIFLKLDLKMWSLVFSTSLSIITVTLHNYLKINKYLK